MLKRSAPPQPGNVHSRATLLLGVGPPELGLVQAVGARAAVLLHPAAPAHPAAAGADAAPFPPPLDSALRGLPLSALLAGAILVPALLDYMEVVGGERDRVRETPQADR